MGALETISLYQKIIFGTIMDIYRTVYFLTLLLILLAVTSQSSYRESRVNCLFSN